MSELTKAIELLKRALSGREDCACSNDQWNLVGEALTALQYHRDNEEDSLRTYRQIDRSEMESERRRFWRKVYLREQALHGFVEHKDLFGFADQALSAFDARFGEK